MRIIYSLLMLVALTSCEKIFDSEQDCDPHNYLKFVYEMNMSGGDGFPAQVTSVWVGAYDPSTGELMQTFTQSGSALSAEGYALSLEGLAPGNYRLVVWGGLEGSNSFRLSSESSLNAMTCTLQTTAFAQGTPVSSSQLSPLFYGNVEVNLVDEPGDHYYTAYLMKDTNNLNLSLQHQSDDPLKADEFDIYMTADNGELTGLNNIVAGNRVLYTPWSVRSGVIDEPGDDMNFLQAEISTCRLMADQNPEIAIVEKATGKTVYSLPVVEMTKKLRSVQYASMTDQEYLDREHEYTLKVNLINGEDGWKAVSIVINGFEI